MSTEVDAELLWRLAHYAFGYMPGPKWSEKEAASRARQAYLDGVMIGQMASVIEENEEAWQKIWRELIGEPT